MTCIDFANAAEFDEVAFRRGDAGHAMQARFSSCWCRDTRVTAKA